MDTQCVGLQAEHTDQQTGQTAALFSQSP